MIRLNVDLIYKLELMVTRLFFVSILSVFVLSVIDFFLFHGRFKDCIKIPGIASLILYCFVVIMSITRIKLEKMKDDNADSR